MLERYFLQPATVDRVRASWIGDLIERYVVWLSERGYAARNVFRRVPILVRFGNFAKTGGACSYQDLPKFVVPFVEWWVAQRPHSRQSHRPLANEARNPIEQMLRLALPEFTGGVVRVPPNPFLKAAPRFFEHLVSEKGLRPSSLDHYRHALRLFEAYLGRIGVHDLRDLSPVILSGFVTENCPRFVRSSVRNMCGVLRVFLRYLHREGVLRQDLSKAVEFPRMYRLSEVPRSITWDEVRRMLEAVDRRTIVGRRDYAILLLLVTYGLRAHEVARLTLDGIDWRRERLRIPERKAGHSTAYPLSPMVGSAILDYLQHGRPATTERHVFFRALAPPVPLTQSAISCRASHYMRLAGVEVPRPGSHTLRHTCVQRLVDAELPLKVIGDYVGHASPDSTKIYTKVAVEALREVALGVGEEVL